MRIELTKGASAEIDDADCHLVAGYKWELGGSKDRPYASARVRTNGKLVCVLMHRLLMGVTDTHIKGDHRDGFGLNNRRSNLRACTHAQNMRNKRAAKSNKYGVKNVYFDKFRPHAPWVASVKAGGIHKRFHFKEFECAVAKAVVLRGELHGEFAGA